MKSYNNLYSQLCEYDNLLSAFRKARKGKTLKNYVIEFEKNLKTNLLQLRAELLLHAYRPKPLKTFILKDPKTRKISKSEFRDRIVHHAICNVIEPLFEERSIYDSYANRKGKGTLEAIKRFDYFKRKTSRNYTKIKDSKNIKGFALKADIKHFFDSVPHKELIRVITKLIRDKKLLWLINIILSNHNTNEKGLGMPLGNLTSQFFANVYLNELDQFVKHKLKAKYYIRYVDDFVILHKSMETLEKYKNKINDFLIRELKLELHPEKSKIFPLYKGTNFLGLKIFTHHKLIKKKNLRKFNKKLTELCEQFNKGIIDYDEIYNFLEGWLAYSQHANTYKLRKKLAQQLEEIFNKEISTKELSRYLKIIETEH